MDRGDDIDPREGKLERREREKLLVGPTANLLPKEKFLLKIFIKKRKKEHKMRETCER